MLIAHGAGAVRGLHLGYITGPRAVPYSFSRAGLAEITVKIHAVMSGKKTGRTVVGRFGEEGQASRHSPAKIMTLKPMYDFSVWFWAPSL
jgi:hypothetical protein